MTAQDATSVTPSEIDAPVAENIQGNTNTRSALDSLFAPLLNRDNSFWVDAFQGTDTARAKAAIERAHANGGGWVVFGPRSYTIQETLRYRAGVNFKGSGRATVIQFGASAGWLFEHDVTDINAQWPVKTKFSEMRLRGNGTGTLGAGASNSGIKCANDDSAPSFANFPFYCLDRVWLSNFKRAVFLEGYGHHVQESMAESCEIGIDLVHPEQVMVLNTWANYCSIGLRVNGTARLPYGHKMHVIGGAYQRCNTAIHIQNFFEPTVDSYFELNGTDIVLGNPDAVGDYDRGVKGARIDGNFASQVSGSSNIALFASEQTTIHFSANGGLNTVDPHVKADGYCKNVDILWDGVSSSAPWNISSEASKTTTIRRVGGELPKPLSTGTNWSLDTANPATVTSTPTGAIQLNGALRSNASATSGTMTTLPLGARPAKDRYVTVPMWRTDTSAWSTENIRIFADGKVQMTAGTVANRVIYLDGITFVPGR